MILKLTVDQEREVLGEVFTLRPELFPYSGLAANTEIVRSAYRGSYDGSAQSFRDIFQTALDAIKRGQLSVNPRITEAFQEAFSGDASQKSGLDCNDQIIIRELVARRLDCTVENIRALISEWWDSLADSPQHTQQQFESDVRARRISEMTNNGTTGFSLQLGPKKFAFDRFGKTFDYQAGMAQGGSLAARGPWSAGQGGFDSMSDDDVATLYEQWRTTNDLKNMSKEDLRRLVKSGGHTDVFGQRAQLPVVDAKDEAALISELTGAEIKTQRELLDYLSNPTNDKHIGGRGRRLVTDKNTGKSIRAKLQRFEEVIKGLRG